jgi:hypothetical protein
VALKKVKTAKALSGAEVSAAEKRFQERNADMNLIGHNSGKADTIKVSVELENRFKAIMYEENKFHKGDLIQWKRGLKNRNLPKEANLMIVEEVLLSSIPVTDGIPPAAVGYGEELDLKVGALAKNPQNGYVDYIEFYIDSRRVEPYVEQDDEAGDGSPS